MGDQDDVGGAARSPLEAFRGEPPAGSDWGAWPAAASTGRGMEGGRHEGSIALSSRPPEQATQPGAGMMSMSKPGTGPMMASGVVPLMHRDGGQAGRGSEGVSLTFHPASAAQHITLPPSLPLVAPGQLAQVAQARQKPFVHRHGRGHSKDVKYDDDFIAHVASEYEKLKLDPHRDAICADKNPAQVVGERFGISEWTVYRHYKRACTDGLIVPADTKFRKSKAATMEATRDTVLSKDAAKKRRPEAEMTLGSGPWTVSVFHIQGAQLDGFSFYCEFWRESGNTFNMWCTLPGVRSSDDLQVRCHEDGQLLLMMNPRHLDGVEAQSSIPAEQLSSLAAMHGLPEEDLVQPFKVKKVVRLPARVSPATASAMVTPKGQFYITVQASGGE